MSPIEVTLRSDLISQTLFQITPLNWAEWQAVLYLSAPVLVIDEVLKFLSVSLLRFCFVPVVLRP